MLACCKTLILVLPTSIREIRTAAKLKAEGLIYFEGSFRERAPEDLSAQIAQIYKRPPGDHQTMVDRFHQRINPRGAQRVVGAIKNWLQNDTL